MAPQAVPVDGSLQTNGNNDLYWHASRLHIAAEETVSMQGLSNTTKGILIGMVSAFGTAALVGIVLAIIYFFRYTSRGRILLDRMSRPGEFDDEQAFLKEEEEALAEMDEMQRTEYLRAKGRCLLKL